MATYYWVGGSGNWNATSTANWSDTSGGSSGFGPPTSADDVIFDAGSNVGTNPFTVTVTGTSAAPAVCKSFTTGGAGGALDGAMTLTMGATARLTLSGSLTLPATNLSVSATSGCRIAFSGATSETLTTNGVSLAGVAIDVVAVGGTLTLGSALTCADFVVSNGTFSTSASNYALTVNALASSNSNVRAINLNASAVTASLSGVAVNFSTSTNLTFNAGTSTITLSGASPTLIGGGVTFYNITFSSTAAGTCTITGANTYNNLRFTSRGTTGIRFVSLGANQTVNGALTFGTANTSIRRMFIFSDVIGTKRTITLNGSLATVEDVDFRDTIAAGTVATPWTGTRLGDCKGNTNITFDAPKTVYWNLAGSQNWSATGWATTNNGVPAANNFPLAQDTATFTEAGSAGTVTFDLGWQVGTIQMADGVSNRTTAFTLATSTQTPTIYGNITLFSNLTLTGTGIVTLAGQGATQQITSATKTFTQLITINSPTGTVQLQDNMTLGSTLITTLTAGTLDLNNNTLSTGAFNSFNTNVRSVAFGTGNITVTGNGQTVLGIETATNFTYTGTPTINATYSGSTGTRNFRLGDGSGGSAANAVLLNITGGSDITAILGFYTNVTYSGFSGSTSFNASLTGNLSLSSPMTCNSTSNTLSFIGTSGTQTITSNGVAFSQPITFNGVGGTFQLRDNLTTASTRTVTLTNGTLDLTGNSGNWTLSTGLFASSNSNTRVVVFGTGNITLTGNAGTVWTTATATNFTYTGTPTINSTYSGSTGTRTVSHGGTTGALESNVMNINISAGTDTFNLSGSWKNVNYSGFSGTKTNSSPTIYGNYTLSSGMTLTAGTGITTFAGTSGTKQITTAGKTLDFPVTVNAPGATVKFVDAFTQGSTRAFTFTNGTVEFLAGATSTVGDFRTIGVAQKFLQSTIAGTQATLSQSSGTVNASYLTIKDINAIGGATWNAYFINNNVDAGNNTGWNFTDSPGNVAEFGMRLRSFTEPRRF